MSAVRISPVAEAHLEAIYEFSARRWGVDQAVVYTDRLIDEFATIAARQSPWRSLPADFGIEGYFRSCESHVIYWRQHDAGSITIVAILHQRMHQIEQLRRVIESP